MTFLYPTFLWALVAVIIPILIHLFNLRSYKTVYFSNVKFLQNIEKQTRTRSTIKHLLILILRILTIISVVLAFAQPVILNNKITHQPQDCDNLACIYIDNSFSMSAEASYGKNSDYAKTYASYLVNSFPKNTRFLFLNNDLQLKHQRFYYPDIIKNFISETRISPNALKMSFIVKKAENLFNEYYPGCKGKLFIISDFQKITSDFENFPADTSVDIFLVPVERRQIPDILIDSVWFATPYRIFMTQDSIFVRIRNASDDAFSDIPLKLYINDTVKAVNNFSIDARQTKEIVMKFANVSKGFLSAKVEITDYPVTYDNQKYFVFEIKKRIPVLLINKNKSTRDFLSLFYSDSLYFDLTETTENNIPYSSFKNYQAVILNKISNISPGLISELKKYTENGGIVAFIPDMNVSTDKYNALLSAFSVNTIKNTDTAQTRISYVNLNDLIYKNSIEKIEVNTVMPFIKRHYKFNNNILTAQINLLKSETDDNLLFYKTTGAGRFYVFAFSPSKENSDFALHPLTSPTFYNITLYSSKTEKIYYILGIDKYINIPNTADFETMELKNANGTLAFIPEIMSVAKDKIRFSITNLSLTAGIYNLETNGKIVEPIAFNYDTKESDLEFYTNEELQKIIKKYNLNAFLLTSKPETINQDLKSYTQGIALWKYFIIAALLFLLAEILVIRLMK